jgi:hypothetical protein
MYTLNKIGENNAKLNLCINLDIFSCRESVLEGDIPFIKRYKNLLMPFAAMVNLAEGLCFNALLTLKAENSFICPVGSYGDNME